jgi:5-methylcytosine-specific restriction endonuclease McrA
MAWESSNRRQELPKNWATLRAKVLKRDGHQCTERDPNTGLRCTEHATDVDHISPGNDHSMTNLRALCQWHHRRKSGIEGGQARQRQLAEQRAQNRRRTARFDRREKHPGEL